MVAESEKPKKHEDIIEEQLEMGTRQYIAPTGRLALSAFTAGLEIGFSLMLMCILYTLFSDKYTLEGLQLILSLGYPLGFVFVVIGRSELFTEHTSLAMIPVLRGEKKVWEMFRLWGIIIGGNLLGGFIFALFLSWIGPAKGIISYDAFHYFGEKLVAHTTQVTLGSAVLAGWMMGLLAWLVTTAQETTSRIIVVVLITIIIGLGSLHHCIVGSVEMLAAVLACEAFDMLDYWYFLWPSVLGNTIGGAIFVSVLKFGQVAITTHRGKN